MTYKKVGIIMVMYYLAAFCLYYFIRNGQFHMACLFIGLALHVWLEVHANNNENIVQKAKEYEA